jgi:hypothetical protein
MSDQKPRRQPPPPPPPPVPVKLSEAVDVFGRWLHMTDPAPLYAVAAAIAANLADGDPVWLLLVGAPSTGKSEILGAATPLSFVHPAAKVTEASLLSGTPSRERSKKATGGLLRQIGAFGILLVKDFTSVLAQNQDTRNQALAALREVYDGRWDRPIGSEGAQVLTWAGKCGLVGGVTPDLDRFHQVISLLGDRFLLLRPAAPDSDSAGRKALEHLGRETEMRGQLAEALGGLIHGADVTAVNRPLSPGERDELVRLARYTAIARTAVARDGYTREMLYHPAPEGPGRLITAFARMLGGMRAIGCDDITAWHVLRQISADCVPAVRSRFAAELIGRDEATRTSDMAAAARMATKNARPHLEDLALLQLVERIKHSDGATAPDYWEATGLLRELWPLNGHHAENAGAEQPDGNSTENASTRDITNVLAGQDVKNPTSTYTYPPLSVSLLSGTDDPRARAHAGGEGAVGIGTSEDETAAEQGEPENPRLTRARASEVGLGTSAGGPECGVCHQPLNPKLAAQGWVTHPTCDPDEPPPDGDAACTETYPPDEPGPERAGP